MTTVLYDRFRE